MHEVALFVEDFAHRQIIGPLVWRLAAECDIEVQLNWRSVVRGHGRVARELDNYLRDLDRQGGRPPDLIVVATDANCSGFQKRVKEIRSRDTTPSRMILAIPDPHVERWLLLDGAAFKATFGRGCDAPDMKCSRDRYKQALIRAILDAGVVPSLGGIEYANDIVREMNIDRAAHADQSFAHFISELRAAFRNNPT